MDFEFSPRTQELRRTCSSSWTATSIRRSGCGTSRCEESGDPYFHPPVMEELKQEARARGLWNLFLPDERFGAGLTNLEYAPLAEITGRSHIAPEALNCAAPDTGNMEILTEFGTPQQQQRLARAAARGRDPLVLRDDRAGGRQLRRHQHPEPHRARRRRVRHQRPQVVDQRRGVASAARSRSSWGSATRRPTRTAATA